ncbi:MAG: diguanylate cyclase, partial [Actinomycetota bacterium]|nr:diguanylate cyclase [Actinomycetota bacterium]
MKLLATPIRSREALRSLRVQVSLALLVAAALCAYVASKSSADELAGAYRETGHQVLAAASKSFSAGAGDGQLEQSPSLDRRARGLLRLHPELRWVGVFRSRADGRPELVASAGHARAIPAGRDADRAMRSRARVESEVEGDGRHLATLAAPLERSTGRRSALALAFDLDASDAALAERSRKILLVLCALLLAFTAFTAAVLDRGIFRPLNRLRAATNRMGSGDLATRLRWRRRDEIGVLARDFDEMAAALERGQKRLEGLAHEDALTGLSNHRHFQETLQREIGAASGGDGSLALAVVDIDYFKRINDARGHPFGDEVLRGAGQRLSAALSGIGYSARLGGDEFAVVLPGADRAQAFALCEAARAAVASFSAAGFELSCSAGVACYPEDARNATDLVQLADGALYWAKSTGRAQS